MGKQQLIDEANRRWKDCDKITPLPGRYMAWGNKYRNTSDNHYQFSGVGASNCFHYNEKDDTLCNWGRGIGLIYRKGVWATKEGEPLPQLLEEIYSIY